MRKKNNKKRECYHRNIEHINSYRKNWPFGRKSDPRYSFKKFYKIMCLDCGRRLE
jgi:hypothetical protein